VAGTQEENRLKKLAEWRARGVDPFGHAYEPTGSLRDIAESFREGDEQRVRAAGRISAMRRFGKAMFLDVRDWTGKLQVYFRRDKVGDDTFARVMLLDLSDIIGVEGSLTRTRTGEITVFADDFTLLTKALAPPPEKWHGLRNVETRYRERHVDLFANPQAMANFLTRVRIIKHVRGYLDERGFVEVETPMMQAIPGGAAARPFITHHNTLHMDLYLRVSPELFLKRLLVGGMERVYEINRNFRNEGISTKHNPEFTMMEVYQAYGDLHAMMALTEGLFAYLAQEIHGDLHVPFGDDTIDLAPPWPRRAYGDLLREHAGVSLDDGDAIFARARELGLEIRQRHKDVVADQLFERQVQPHLKDPTFVIDYPVALCPLTRACPDNPGLAQRFELFVASMEMANAYTELNDPIEQEKRFREQVEQEEGELRCVDEDFLDALRHGMPPRADWASASTGSS